MNMFGFTIISTKKLDELKKEIKEREDTCASLRKKLVKTIVKSGTDLLDAVCDREQELRKWSVEVGISHPYYQYKNAENTYRYVKTGDTSIFEDYEEFLEWRKRKKEDAATASESHSDSPSL